jgi:hypothetical protein
LILFFFCSILTFFVLQIKSQYHSDYGKIEKKRESLKIGKMAILGNDLILCSQVSSISPFLLQAHPMNVAIYGDDEDTSQLREMINRSKWIKPLIVTPKGIIISGHRRWEVAKELNLETIPIEVKEFQNEIEQLEFLLLENATRTKTIEQRVREGKIWEEIEKEKAKERQKMGAILTNSKLGRNTGETGVANLTYDFNDLMITMIRFFVRFLTLCFPQIT